VTVNAPKPTTVTNEPISSVGPCGRLGNQKTSGESIRQSARRLGSDLLLMAKSSIACFAKSKSSVVYKKPPSTLSILTIFENKGLEKVNARMNRVLPKGLSLDKLVEIETNTGKQQGITLNGNLLVDSKLTRLAVCCVAERYAQKYGIEIFHIGAPRGQDALTIADFVAPLLAEGQAIGLIMDQGGKSNYHSIPLAFIPDLDSGKLHMLDCNSVSARVDFDAEALFEETYGNWFQVNPVLDAIAAKMQLEPSMKITQKSRQADHVSCHTDALQTLKEVLRDGAAVGRKMVNLTGGNELKFVAETLKTAQLPQFLNDYDLTDIYRDKQAVSQHRAVHTKDVLIRGKEKKMNLFLPAKTLQYAHVAADVIKLTIKQHQCRDAHEAAELIVQKRSIVY
jgi:hypothetical protein